ncbi:MAG: hypothetical protein A3F11_02175 [Gammaproteobacteria bacterium RIFCSPHIGHO2_12_FULL_37_14]|nr:MAG: hypothetical protein A3F11_02175 [Gammaproteobacteria bacterium RIFCSPHIGHO2_12_FULL_37_14]
MSDSRNWWKEDLLEKEKILFALYDKTKAMESKNQTGLAEYIASCSDGKILPYEVNNLFSEAAKGVIKKSEFITFFNWLSPLDAKMLDLNLELGIKQWQESGVSATHFTEQQKIQLEQYLKDSQASVTVALGNAAISEKPLTFGSKDPYAIHSINKIFTGVLVLRLIEEKPDGKTSILPKDMLNSKVEFDPGVLEKLPSALRSHLEANNVTLFQFMTHMGGTGDYGLDRGTGSYRDTIESGKNPEIQNISDFLPFGEDKIYDVSKGSHYSNLGFILVGLALEHAYNVYRENHPSLKLPELDFNGLMNRYLKQEAGMQCFTPKCPENGKFNPTDKAAQHMLGSPAGGYWTAADDLAKFAKWLYLHSSEKGFKSLMIQYGKEFYDSSKDVIHHPGSSVSASSLFALSLKTGNYSIALSDQQGVAHSVGLEFLLGDRIFKRDQVIGNKKNSTFNPTPS